MLVLSRKLEETILIGENVKIKVLEIRGGQVRLGIEAPRSVNIVRSELIAEESAERESDKARQNSSEFSRIMTAI